MFAVIGLLKLAVAILVFLEFAIFIISGPTPQTEKSTARRFG